MPSEADAIKLMWYIIFQQTNSIQSPPIDWQQIAQQMGLENRDAARMRWNRLKADLIKNHGLTIPEITNSDDTPVTPKVKKSTNLKPKFTDNKGKANETPKKRKLEVTEQEVENDGNDEDDIQE